MLNIEIVEKKYGAAVVLRGLSIEINSPGIYGIVGKNGAGKTSLFKCISGLESFEGHVLFDGEKVISNRIFWCPTEPVLYDELTTVEFNSFYAQLLGLNPSNAKGSFFDVPGDQLLKGFSTGMRKKAYLNAALQGEYVFYIFDEPFNGLDIESNLKLIRYMKVLAESCIVFVSSHLLDTLKGMCKKMYLVHDGALEPFLPTDFERLESYFVSNFEEA